MARAINNQSRASPFFDALPDLVHDTNVNTIWVGWRAGAHDVVNDALRHQAAALDLNCVNALKDKRPEAVNDTLVVAALIHKFCAHIHTGNVLVILPVRSNTRMEKKQKGIHVCESVCVCVCVCV